MDELNYTFCSTRQELQGIMDLQQKNLRANLSDDEITKQGFVTVVHTIEQLDKMNQYAQHAICKHEEKVIAYLLAMTVESKHDIPVLAPLFDLFETVSFRNRPISSYQYMVVGQVCVDKRYRGKGILKNCYEMYRNHFQSTYAFAITEIAVSNTRSRHAHQKIGFTEIHQYTDGAGIEWSIVIWDWKNERAAAGPVSE